MRLTTNNAIDDPYAYYSFESLDDELDERAPLNFRRQIPQDFLYEIVQRMIEVGDGEEIERISRSLFLNTSNPVFEPFDEASDEITEEDDVIKLPTVAKTRVKVRSFRKLEPLTEVSQSVGGATPELETTNGPSLVRRDLQF